MSRTVTYSAQSTADVIAAYQGLLIVQYYGQNNAMATIATVISAMLQNQILIQIRDGFDIDTAVGAQLDTLGNYLGVSRYVYGLSTRKQYMAFPSYTDAARATYPGMNLYSVPSGNSAFFLTYADMNSVVYTMTDFVFQIIWKGHFKILFSIN